MSGYFNAVISLHLNKAFQIESKQIISTCIENTIKRHLWYTICMIGAIEDASKGNALDVILYTYKWKQNIITFKLGCNILHILIDLVLFQLITICPTSLWWYETWENEDLEVGGFSS